MRARVERRLGQEDLTRFPFPAGSPRALLTSLPRKGLKQKKASRISPVVFFYNLPSPKIIIPLLLRPIYTQRDLYHLHSVCPPPKCGKLKKEEIRGLEIHVRENFIPASDPILPSFPSTTTTKIKFMFSITLLTTEFAWEVQKGYEHFLPPIQAWKKLGPTSHYLISPASPHSSPLPRRRPLRHRPHLPSRPRAPAPSTSPPHSSRCCKVGGSGQRNSCAGRRKPRLRERGPRFGARAHG